jgi:hypothetical protein
VSTVEPTIEATYVQAVHATLGSTISSTGNEPLESTIWSAQRAAVVAPIDEGF